MTPHNTDWLSQAICKGKTSLFFIPKEKETKKQRLTREKIAITYCLQCPVIDECRTYARENNEYGIWGAENEEMRWKAGYLRSNKTMKDNKYSRRYGSEILDETKIVEIRNATYFR
jgi:hypothetical protein